MLRDEPTEGIQPSIIDSIAELLSELNAATGLTVLVVEQSLGFLSAIARRVAVLYRGKAVAMPELSRLSDPDAMELFGGTD